MRAAAKCLLILSLALSASTVRAQGTALDPELEAGIRKVDEGNFEAGIQTLDAVVKKLRAAGDKPLQLSRAYLYLGIAHLQLSQEQAARARFAEAARADRTLKLSEYEFPPSVVRLFDEAKKAAASEGPQPTPAVRRKLPPEPFLEAVKSGDFATTRRMLAEDASLIQARDAQFDATPLHWAALRGHGAVAGLLVAAGADLSARNRAGETAEDVARRAKRTDMVQVLSGRPGAAPAVAPAQAAAPSGTTTGVSVFDAAKTGNAARLREILDASPGLVSARDTAFGATPLHWAALRGHVEVARLLVARGASVDATNSAGETPLDVARRAKRADVEAVLGSAARRPDARFLEAARQGDAAAVRQMLDEDKRLIGERDPSFGATALHWAALRGHAAVVRVLLERGADRRAVNSAGETPLDVARRAKREEVVRLLSN